MKKKPAVNCQNDCGFTLMEMIVVLAIISILALAAMPSSTGKINRAYISENLQLVEPFTEAIAKNYAITGSFPADNTEAGFPKPELITGNYLESVEVENGALHLTLGQKIGGDLKGKILSLRPVYVPDAVSTPISWICGYDAIPEKMDTPAENRTDIDRSSLPLQCL